MVLLIAILRDSDPRVEPRTESRKGAVVGGHRAPRESECCSQELAALLEHALLDHLVRPLQ